MSTVINFSGSSGGAALNYDVIGSTSTPTPSENLIWVNTENTITSHIFSSSEPENPTEGLVWFNTGGTSNVAFSVTEENPIYVYPNSCKQYVSNEWVSKTAKTYLNGAWVSWSLAIYAPGDQNVFTAKSYKHTGADQGAAPTVTYGTEYMTASITNIEFYSGSFWNTSGIIVSNKFDLTNYTSIRFDYTDYSVGHTNDPVIFYISDNNTSFDSTYSVNAETGASSKTIDVSSITGEKYIGVLLYAGAGYSTTTSIKILGITAE